MLLKEKPIAWVDCETTGLDPELNEVIDVAVVFDIDIVLAADGAPWTTGLRFKDDYAYFQTRVRPTRLETADPKALEVNGYAAHPQGWDNAPMFPEIAERLHGMLTNSVIAGHNSPFDIGFLEAEFRRIGIKPEMARHRIDTVSIVYEHLVPCGVNALNLDTICSFLGISNERSHTALADALRCRAVYKKLERATTFHRLWWKYQASRKHRS